MSQPTDTLPRDAGNDEPSGLGHPKLNVAVDRLRANEGTRHRPQALVSELTGEIEEDSYLLTAFPRLLDRLYHASLARVTNGLSPGALLSAFAGWYVHLCLSPGKQLQLNEKFLRKVVRLQKYIASCALPNNGATPCIEPLPQDRRFRAPEWQKLPYNLVYQSFLLQQQWWHNATTGIRGVEPRNELIVEFATRQLLDLYSPSNFLFTNPALLRQTFEQGGANLVKGAKNYTEDWQNFLSGLKPDNRKEFEIGIDLAATPGQVVYRNELIELIQYKPVTEQVSDTPILITPAWIMKYYILDLGRQNSLVRFLVEQGFTVFMISWKNPGPDYRNFGMNDYLRLGVLEALDAVASITQAEKVHGVGYCLGGTLLSIAAAWMARDGDDRLKTVSLLAAQTDFTEPGELELFINESEVAFLEDMMWDKGYLDSHQMAGTFQLLRSNDLIWSRAVKDYLRGERGQMSDMTAWNADSTRMPYRMHSEYLRKLFLNNDLAEGRYEMDGRSAVLTDIRAPLFVIGTERDHIAPWQSVYKVHLLTDTDVTFALISGGHNGGIVSPPGRQGRHYQIATQKADGQYIDPESWAQQMIKQEGSWWPEWITWLQDRSGNLTMAPPAMGAASLGYGALCDAPGTYVLEK